MIRNFFSLEREQPAVWGIAFGLYTKSQPEASLLVKAYGRPEAKVSTFE
jgi:hypothetical protein